MAATGKRVRVTLRRIQILDSLDLDGTGEFRFRFRVSTRNRGGVEQETRYPPDGHLSISDHPAWNRIEKIDKVLFESEVDDHLVVEAFGEEIDLLSPNDQLETYRRSFDGPPESWAGRYTHWDESADGVKDPENMSNWRIGYEIELLD
jgi:hypothetical protein